MTFVKHSDAPHTGYCSSGTSCLEYESIEAIQLILGHQQHFFPSHALGSREDARHWRDCKALGTITLLDGRTSSKMPEHKVGTDSRTSQLYIDNINVRDEQ